MKICTKCNKTKALSRFYMKSQGYLRSECRLCTDLANKAYAANNKARIDGHKAAYKIRNPKQEAISATKWRKNNKAKVNARTALRRANLDQRTPKWLTASHYQQIEVFYASAAALTKEFGVLMAVDHIVPLHGKNVSGLHVPWNLQVLTTSENSRKWATF